MTDLLNLMNNKPDVIIIGSGVGGACVALKLAESGHRVVIVERGEKLKDEPQLNDPEAVFVQNRYRTTEHWQDDKGDLYRPGQYYYVGGHTKFYGTAMFRFRESDFAEVTHEEGISPAWPIRYADLESHYGEAEQLFGVRGNAYQDPTEPWRSANYNHPAIPHEPLIQRMADGLSAAGLTPFHMPSAIDFGPNGNCVRCGTCDAFVCRHDAKGDAENRILNRILALPNVSLLSGCKVTKLIHDADGAKVSAVEIERTGVVSRLEAPLFVLSAGAINSALILLNSASRQCPEGLANRSGVVGRYLMNHHLTGLMGILPFEENLTKFPKTLSLNDFYLGIPNDSSARGNIQMLGNIQGPMIRSALPQAPSAIANWVGRHSVDWLIMSEDPPVWENGVRLLPDGTPEIRWHPADFNAHDRFVKYAKKYIKALGFPVVLRHSFGIKSPSHQCGTVRMGRDPNHSAIDPLCRAHDHANLYVVDASFFVSSAAVNPALTVAAQALRVGEHLAKQLATQPLVI